MLKLEIINPTHKALPKQPNHLPRQNKNSLAIQPQPHSLPPPLSLLSLHAPIPSSLEHLLFAFRKSSETLLMMSRLIGRLDIGRQRLSFCLCCLVGWMARMVRMKMFELLDEVLGVGMGWCICRIYYL